MGLIGELLMLLYCGLGNFANPAGIAVEAREVAAGNIDPNTVAGAKN
jgi:hypothetical protein